jgi:RHS repeat-associated protein
VGSISYEYDDAGDRVGRDANGVITTYLVDPNRAYSQVLEERDGLGNLMASYVHGAELLVRRDGTGTAEYAHPDGRLSTRVLTDATGAITDSYAYDAFGRLESHVGASPNPYRFGGQYEDRDAGLYHLRARWLDPNAGRFLTTDPFGGFAGAPRTLHRYSYAYNNPVSYGDPGGAFASMASISVSAGVLSSLQSMNLSWNASAAFAFHTYSSAFSDLVKLRMDAMFKLSEATASPAELEEAYELILASGQGLQVAALRVGRDIAFGMATDGSLRLFFRAFGPLARLFGKVPGGSWLYGVGQRFFRTVASKGLQSGQKLVGGARRIGGWAWTKVKNLLPRPGKGGSPGVSGSSDWAQLSGMLRSAAKGKGNFGIGSATREQAQAMGKAWVGPGFKTASDGKTLLSADGLRQFRPPSFKPSQGKVQANFEARPPGVSQWQSNAHLDILN